MIQNDHVRSAFRPDLEHVSRERVRRGGVFDEHVADPMGRSRSTSPMRASSSPQMRPVTSPPSHCRLMPGAPSAESSARSENPSTVAFERVLGLDHRPVPTVGKHVQFGVGDGAHRDQLPCPTGSPGRRGPTSEASVPRPCASSPTASGRRMPASPPSSERTPPCRTCVGQSASVSGSVASCQRSSISSSVTSAWSYTIERSQSTSRCRVGSSVKSCSRRMPSLGPGLKIFVPIPPMVTSRRRAVGLWMAKLSRRRRPSNCRRCRPGPPPARPGTAPPRPAR